MDDIVPWSEIVRLLAEPSVVQTGSAFVVGTQARRIVVASVLILSSIASLVTLVSFMVNHPRISLVVVASTFVGVLLLSTGCSTLSSTQTEVDVSHSSTGVFSLTPSFGGSQVCGEDLFALQKKKKEVARLVLEQEELKSDFDECIGRSKSMLLVNPFNNFRRDGNEQ